MAILQIVLSALMISWATADDSCPTKAEIAPCTCDGEGFNCMGARTLDEIRRAFRANFKYGGVRSVWVQGTPITNIPGDLFGNVKSQQFYVEINNVTSVDFQAFSASKKTMRLMSLFGNKIVNLDYSALAQFEMLDTLNLGRNLITSIPDNAFSSRSLHAIIFAQNKISHVGKNAFSNLPSLGKLEMSMNQITTLGPLSFAITANPGNLQINLAANRISNVSSTAFEGATPLGLYLQQNNLRSLPPDSFKDLIVRMGNRGGALHVYSNPFSCNGCDYSWIVLNKDLLQNRIYGLTCEDGRDMQRLTKSNINCNN